MCGLKETRLRTARVGKSATLETEEFGLEKRLRDRCAVHIHKGTAGARAGSVDRPGNQTFTGPGFPAYKNGRQPLPRCPTRYQPSDLFPDGVDCGTLAYELTQRIDGGHYGSLPPRLPAQTIANG